MRIAAAALLVGASPALAQQSAFSPSEDPGRIFSLQIENDSLADSDKHYTNGLRLAVLTSEADAPQWVKDLADWAPLFKRGSRERVSFAVGQSMYTPERIERRPPDPRDRPYAGWLYASVGLVADAGNRLDNVELSLGVVGPSARAKEAQRTWHEIIDATEPRGWGSQLHDEPAILLAWERKWRNPLAGLPFGLAADAAPHVGASLGNVFTLASTGLTLRFGYDLPQDYGVPRVRPAAPGSDFFAPRGDFAWYAFVGGEGRAVARNIFLDGNSWKDSADVDKLPLVGDLYAGVAVTWRNMRIAYTHTLRSPEFEEQSEFDNFGALSLSFRF